MRRVACRSHLLLRDAALTNVPRDVPSPPVSERGSSPPTDREDQLGHSAEHPSIPTPSRLRKTSEETAGALPLYLCICARARTYARTRITTSSRKPLDEGYYLARERSFSKTTQRVAAKVTRDKKKGDMAYAAAQTRNPLPSRVCSFPPSSSLRLRLLAELSR